MTDNYLQSVGFMSFLLATTACFDVLSISDSKYDNWTTCHVERGSKLAEWTTDYHNPCSFLNFWLLSVMCFASAGIVYASHSVMAQFRKSIAIDGL